MPIIDLTDQEFQALAGLLDAATRAVGLRAVKDASAILLKMEAAQALTSAPAEKHPPLTGQEAGNV